MRAALPSGVVDPSEGGVWRYRGLLDDLPWPESRAPRIDLGDGPAHWHRVQVEGVPLWLQREDLNPHGSHKDRAAAVQVTVHALWNGRKLCISSSGNAAVATAAAARAARTPLVAFVHPRTPPAKLAALVDRGAHVVVSERAISLCRAFAARTGAVNLRASSDDAAVAGYRCLAGFQAESGPEVDAVFAYATTGATLLGMWQGFERLRRAGWHGAPPALWAAQAGQCTALARAFGASVPPQRAERSIVGDLGARRSRRHGAVVRALRASGGGALAVGDAAIEAARQALLDVGVAVGLESACAAAAAVRAAREGTVRAPMVLVTGHWYAALSPPPPGGMRRAETIEELDDLVGAFGRQP